MTTVFRLGAVEAALLTLFPAGVAVAAERLGKGREGDLWPEERAMIAGAVPARRHEFAAGRIAARRVLGALGQESVGLAADADRAAVWPAGISGSIAHAGGVAVAVGRSGAALGVDVEPDMGLEADLWPVICAPDELDALPEVGRARLVRHIFCAKEAVFKAQDPARRVLFGFDAVAVTLTDGGFVVRFREAVGAFTAGQIVQGRLAVVQGLVLTGVAA
jgi:4'-phosphopantetheinyl transferase EntD